jgi:hypothetical protein
VKEGEESIIRIGRRRLGLRWKRGKAEGERGGGQKRRQCVGKDESTFPHAHKELPGHPSFTHQSRHVSTVDLD